ncbi:MarR family transcriptional regulator [Sedimentitalea sp. CAU 1593]|uniref:MarR family transcriptional regulator n=2 Tax=Sedimentitalea arenosa TaxID=2798803 RepID=A0A8J7LXD2_9RHOB|nr:MarR family transcriptional regulator [Arenibacterium arenosum]
MTSDNFNLSEFLPYKLSVLSSRTTKMLSKVYGEKYGLSTPEWRVLVHVARREKMSVREIHDSVYLEKPAVSRAVAKLEKAGLLRKTTCDKDHRLVEIELTEGGLYVFNGIVPEALSFEAAILSAFSPEERDQLHDLMERLHDVLDRLPDATRRPQMDNDTSGKSSTEAH